jgi:RNA polymerase sigma-70 factor, ECF subfamily
MKKVHGGIWRVREARVNGLAGFVSVDPAGGLQTAAFDIDGGRITAIYVVANPDKLRRVAF